MTKRLLQPITTLGAALAGLSLLACTSTDPVRVEEDFGNSVRHMVRSQVHDPVAAAQPALDAPEDMHGPYGDSVMETYRKDVGDPRRVRESFEVRINEGR